MGLGTLLKSQMQTDLLITPKHELALAKRDGGEVQLSREVADWVAKALVVEQRDRTGAFSASRLGQCRRQQVYGFLGLPFDKYPSSDTNAIFRAGTWIHLKWQADGFTEGWLRSAEIFVHLPERRLKGTMDGILTDGEGVEFKSANSRSYRDVLYSGVKPQHLLQIGAYMLATGIEKFAVVYENKDTQEWKEYVVAKSEELESKVTEELDALNGAIDTKTLPARLAVCAGKDGYTYRSCPFRERCFASDAFPRDRVRPSAGIRVKR